MLKAMTPRRCPWTVAVLPCLLLAGCGSAIPVLTTTLPTGAVGLAYTASALVADTAEAIEWRIVDGQFPPGLALNSATGAISGVPTLAGTFTFTAEVISLGTPSAGQVTLAIVVHPRLAINPVLAPARIGEPYAAAVDVSGGVPPYTFEAVLPAGLAIEAASGIISGQINDGTTAANIDVSVADSGTPRQTAQARIRLTVLPRAVSIQTTTLAQGRVGQAYSDVLVAAYGQQPYRWEVIDGVLPTGATAANNLRLNQTTGQITGVPGSPGDWTFTVRVSDAQDPESTALRTLTITIVPAS